MNKKENHILEIVHDHHLRFEGMSGIFSVMGGLSFDLSSLRASVHIASSHTHKQRLRLDLYDYAQVQRSCEHLSELYGFSFTALEQDFLRLTDLLEQYREELYKKEFVPETASTPRLALTIEKETVEHLKSSTLLSDIQELLLKAGIVGEDITKLVLFIIASSYKSDTLLSGLVSGSGAQYIINTIAECFPQEEVVKLSRITSKSLFHYKKQELDNKLIIIQDFDRLDKIAQKAFSQLKSQGELSSSVTGKDQWGNPLSRIHTVKARFSSIGAGESETNLNLYTDESVEQTERIASASITQVEQTQAQGALQNMMRLLKSVEVVNPFETQIALASHLPHVRSLGKQLRQFVKHIAFLHQYQREYDEKGRIIATKEDVELGEYLFTHILHAKTDELSPKLRSFFEELKTYLKKKSKEDKETSFIQREIRHALHISRSALHRYIQELVSLEYLAVIGGSKNRGLHYTIVFWDAPKPLASHRVPNALGHQNQELTRVVSIASHIPTS